MKRIFAILLFPYRHMIIFMFIFGLVHCCSVDNETKYEYKYDVSDLQISHKSDGNKKHTTYSFKYVDELGNQFDKEIKTHYGKINYQIKQLVNEHKLYEVKDEYNFGVWMMFILLAILIFKITLFLVWLETENDNLDMFFCWFIFTDEYPEIMFGSYDLEDIFEELSDKLKDFFGYGERA